MCAPGPQCCASFFSFFFFFWVFFFFFNYLGPSISVWQKDFFLFLPLQLHFGSSCTFPVRSVIGNGRNGEDKGNMGAREQGHEFPFGYGLVWDQKRTGNSNALTPMYNYTTHTRAHIHTYPHTASPLQSEQNSKRLLCADLVGGQVLPVCLGVYTVKWQSSMDIWNSFQWNIHKCFCVF